MKGLFSQKKLLRNIFFLTEKLLDGICGLWHPSAMTRKSMTLAAYLKAKRKTQKGPLSRLAEKLGTSPGYLSLIAQGKRVPSRAMAAKISKATGGVVTIAKILKT